MASLARAGQSGYNRSINRGSFPYSQDYQCNLLKGVHMYKILCLSIYFSLSQKEWPISAYLGCYTTSTLLALLSHTPDLLLGTGFCVSVKKAIKNLKQERTQKFLYCFMFISHIELCPTHKNECFVL